MAQEIIDASNTVALPVSVTLNYSAMRTLRKQLVKNSLFYLLLLSFFGCQGPKAPESLKDYFEITDNVQRLKDTTEKNQLIIYRKPGTTAQELKDWLDKFTKNYGKISIISMCQSCDSSLLLATGEGVTTFIQPLTPRGMNSPEIPPQGDDGPIMYSVNYAYNIPEDRIKRNIRFDKPVKLRGINLPKDTVVVAVFDTGLDTVLASVPLYKGSGNSSCLNVAADRGWNFADNNANWFDDYPDKHGTLVSKYIVDQVVKLSFNEVKILPVKVHDKNGYGSLYNLLCAIAYAKDRGADIINASLGFYTARVAIQPNEIDPAAVMLSDFVEHHLTKNNILLLAAAGNQNNALDVLNPIPSDTRNLDSVSFYPASLSRKLKNVISVTTMDSTGVDSSQNYSPQVVTVGVNPDIVITNSQFFFSPIPMGGGNTLIGSSFATPIVAGKIAALFKRNITATKAQALQLLSTVNQLHPDTRQSNLVENGNSVKK